MIESQAPGSSAEEGEIIAPHRPDAGSIGGILEDTGERMVPEKAIAATFWEHIYRYRFAARFVRGRRVLDIACGEGYGTAALLKAGAAHVIGVDLSARACEHARKKYGVDARVGSAAAIPLPDQSIDLVVSFETIEHVEKPDLFLDECVRVLAPGGRLVISTPDRDAFAAIGNDNPFHCSELSEREFVSLLRWRFPRFDLYTQRLKSAGWWSTRSLAVELSPWLQVRGYCRLRSLLAPVCPHLQGAVEEKYRQSPVEAILAHDHPLSTLVNHYAVRRSSRTSNERPYYWLAVARV